MAPLVLSGCMALLFISSIPTAWAGIDSGGGDLCESRIVTIRDDLRQWIEKGGGDSLKLPDSVTSDQYSTGMREQIARAKIRCVGPEDRDYPVTVDGTPKVCRFDRSWTGKTKITCDSAKFSQLSESDQYVLVHHEYAGLAGVENPKGDQSTYTISNQLSEYLVDVVVKRLAVKKPPAERSPGCVEIGNGFSECVTNLAISYTNVNQAKPRNEHFRAQVIARIGRDYCVLWDAKHMDRPIPCQENTLIFYNNVNRWWVIALDNAIEALKENVPDPAIAGTIETLLRAQVASGARPVFGIPFGDGYYGARFQTKLSSSQVSGEVVTFEFIYRIAPTY